MDDLFPNCAAAGGMVENIPDQRPGPMYAGPDRYFDEPEQASVRLTGLMGWSARAKAEQRDALVRFATWCAQAPDGERRAIFVLFDQFQGRTPAGVIEETAKQAGVSRQHVCRAIQRFNQFFPGVVSGQRRRSDTGRLRDRKKAAKTKGGAA